MGMMTEARIEAWQKAAGIRPATGRQAELLRKMSDAAFELIKVIELHRSGICDGDGCWHGSDVMGGTALDLVHIINEYLGRTTDEYEAQLKKHGITTDDIPW
jgi:hypothetical protein